MIERTTRRYKELLELVSTFDRDFFKFYEKGNKTAGIRLRKNMQSLRQFAVDVRNEIQDVNQEREDENDQ